jgi:hypothetical protein
VHIEPRGYKYNDLFCERADGRQRFEQMQQLLFDLFSDRIYFPDELTAGFPSAHAALTQRGWPRVADMRGEIVFNLNLFSSNAACKPACRRYRTHEYITRISCDALRSNDMQRLSSLGWRSSRSTWICTQRGILFATAPPPRSGVQVARYRGTPPYLGSRRQRSMSVHTFAQTAGSMQVFDYLRRQKEQRRRQFVLSLHYQPAIDADPTEAVATFDCDSGELSQRQTDLLVRLGVLLHPVLMAKGAPGSSRGAAAAHSHRALVQGAINDRSPAHRFVHALATGEYELRDEVTDTYASALGWRKALLTPFAASEMMQKLNEPSKMDVLQGFMARTLLSSKRHGLTKAFKDICVTAEPRMISQRLDKAAEILGNPKAHFCGTDEFILLFDNLGFMRSGARVTYVQWCVLVWIRITLAQMERDGVTKLSREAEEIPSDAAGEWLRRESDEKFILSCVLDRVEVSLCMLRELNEKRGDVKLFEPDLSDQFEDAQAPCTNINSEHETECLPGSFEVAADDPALEEGSSGPAAPGPMGSMFDNATVDFPIKHDLNALSTVIGIREYAVRTACEARGGGDDVDTPSPFLGGVHLGMDGSPAAMNIRLPRHGSDGARISAGAFHWL